MHLVAIGGSDAGISAALRARAAAKEASEADSKVKRSVAAKRRSEAETTD